MSMGTVAIFFDLYLDVWYYAYIGTFHLFLIHIFLLGVFIGLCLWIKVNPLWVIVPMGLEVAFVFALNYVTGAPFIPGITIALGSMVGFISVVFRCVISKEKLESHLFLV